MMSLKEFLSTTLFNQDNKVQPCLDEMGTWGAGKSGSANVEHAKQQCREVCEVRQECLEAYASYPVQNLPHNMVIAGYRGSGLRKAVVKIRSKRKETHLITDNVE